MSEMHSQSVCHSAYRRAFFRGWLRDPFHVAALTPSGRALARTMAAGLEPGMRVVELGSGTGNVTRAILDNGVHASDLWLVENDRVFAGILRRRFPHASVLEVNAAAIGRHLVALAGSVDVVVSGLPIVWFDRSKKNEILSGAFSLLRPRGRFVQFTYLGRSPVGGALRTKLGLRTSLTGICPINLPPAFVYCFERS